MSVTVLVPPALDPVSLADAKAFLQLDSTFEDALVADLIKTATQMIEKSTAKALISRTVQQEFQSWPERGIFALALRPLVQIVQVQRRDATGTLSAVDPADYYVDTGHGRLIALTSFTHGPFSHPAEAVLVDFITGFGPAESDIPPALRSALMLIVRDLYEHRGENAGAMPLRAQALLAPFSPVRL